LVAVSTIPRFDGFALGGRQARARELAARAASEEETIARLRAELADALARAAAAEDRVRVLAALLESRAR
jgi:hypothetical protein